jgi:hypothetical protein
MHERGDELNLKRADASSVLQCLKTQQSNNKRWKGGGITQFPFTLFTRVIMNGTELQLCSEITLFN